MTELLGKYRAFYKREITKEEFKKCNTLAYNAYVESIKIADEWNEYHMILSNLYQDGYKDIVDCVRDLGFSHFYITDRFSSLIERLGTLPDYCNVCGVEKICTGTNYNEMGEENPRYEYALCVSIEKNRQQKY